jgi:hypothetical protein
LHTHAKRNSETVVKRNFSWCWLSMHNLKWSANSEP